MSEFNHQNIEDGNQAEIKYPIILHQNTSINAKPPYKVLRFPNGDFMQLIDMHCRRFNDPAISGGSYSIALFKIREEESALIQTRPDRLDFLAKMLYQHVPADRFVRASVVRENVPYDIKVEPGCQTIDTSAAPDVPQPEAVRQEQQNEAPAAETVQRPEASAPAANDIGRLNLNIVPDMLNDFQRETYVFAPIRSARCIAADELAALNLTELMSVAFVTSKCNVDRMPQFNKNAKEANFKTALNAVAVWLKNNPFFIIYDRSEGAPVKLFNNGVPFTPVFSSCALAENVVFGNDRVECVEISVNKDAFFLSLLERGIVQFIVDGNPLTLAVQGYYHYMTRE